MKTNYFALFLLGGIFLSVQTVSAQSITEETVHQAQKTWIQALVSISQTHAEGGDAAARASEVLRTYYDFVDGSVLFKPTLTFGEQTHRTTYEGALAYFVGGNSNFPNDDGFALTNYVDGTVEMAGVVIIDNVAIAQSNITLITYDGSSVTVNKTFAYRLDDSGNLRIITHHSSLPFTPPAS